MTKRDVFETHCSIQMDASIVVNVKRCYLYL